MEKESWLPLQDVQPTIIPFNDYLPEPVPFLFYLRPTTTTEIKTLINSLKDTSSGHDEVNTKSVKRCNDIISPFLEYIINSSFRNGIFPKQL